MKYILSLFIALLLLTKATAGTDSLKVILQSNVHDTVRLKVLTQLIKLAKEESPAESEKYALEAIKLAEKIGDKKTESKVSHNLGIEYYLSADYPLALHYYLKSLKIREQLGDSVNMAKSYNNIALVYYEQNELDHALENHYKSVAIKEKLYDIKGLGASYGNIGNVYNRRAQALKNDSLYAIAYNFHIKALKIQQQIQHSNPDDVQNLIGLSGTYNNMGTISLDRALLNKNSVKGLQTALDCHTKALEIQNKIEDIRGMSHSYINVAGVYEKLNRHEESVNSLLKALKILENTEYREELKACYEGLANTYERVGDYKNELKYFKLYAAIKDTILDATKTEQIVEMREKYGAEKKTQEIELLNKNKALADVEIQKQTIIKNSLIAGFSLVILLVLIMYNRYRIKVQSGKRLEAQNQLIAQKNKEITDSIMYAKNIQLAILPPSEYLNVRLPEHFVFYEPKDIVSGDFYWVDDVNDTVYIAAVDCTGHGVPGAFMSIVGYNLLKHAIHEHRKTIPGDILDRVNFDLSETLKQAYKTVTVKDGMDLALCSLDRKNGVLQYAGANNSIYLYQNGSLTEIKADKMPIGTFFGEEAKPFTNHTIPVQKGDLVYMFTDGYADQFGGKEGKKFKYKQFRELIEKVAVLPLEQQKSEIEKAFKDWMAAYEQVDDVLIFAFKV